MAVKRGREQLWSVHEPGGVMSVRRRRRCFKSKEESRKESAKLSFTSAMSFKDVLVSTKSRRKHISDH